ncbi:MAG TPA: nucleoside triphosphate pyrophosphohydrolase [Ruminococcaceae bacterium]|nr:nucleoside triphosphate pyrophosphohydrolase [Oscillospiraceae bacterium]
MVQHMKCKKQHDLKDLLDIVRLLRSDCGCPWDREQTHQSVRGEFLEEAYEAVDAIDQRDSAALCEELGDVLLQVVFHSQIESESGGFAFEDVVDGICKKLILRHPHVFGDVIAETPGEVKKNWDEIKRREKGQSSYTETLKSVPKAMPALMRAAKVQNRAKKAGFDWPEISGALDKITEETAELRTAIADGQAGEIENELGDLLFSVVNVSRFIKVNPERAAELATEKFISRFDRLERLAAQRGIDMKESSLAQLDALWDEIKNR